MKGNLKAQNERFKHALLTIIISSKYEKKNSYFTEFNIIISQSMTQTKSDLNLWSLVRFGVLSLVRFDPHYYSDKQLLFPHRSSLLLISCFVV